MLRSVDYGEADRVVTLLTRAHGKLPLLARGARRSKRRFGGALEPFALLRVDFVPSSSGLGRLDSASVARAFPALLGDLSRMTVGGALVSLARELLPDGAPDSDIFDDMLHLMAALDERSLPERTLSLTFQAALMGRAGFSPRLSTCGRCGKPAEPGRAADFDPVRGQIICQACGGAAQRLSGPAREALQRAADGDFLGAAAEPLRPEELEAALRALRAFIDARLERVRST